MKQNAIVEDKKQLLSIDMWTSPSDQPVLYGTCA